MLRTFPAPSNCYLYGPVCVAAAERGKGFVGAMYEESRSRLPGRPALTLVRSDNAPSLQAHRRMGMTELGEFTNEGDSYIVFAFSG
jgi:L-amino acid N-acyltransferase YncA